MMRVSLSKVACDAGIPSTVVVLLPWRAFASLQALLLLLLASLCVSTSVMAKRAEYNVALVDHFYPGPSGYDSADAHRLALGLYGMMDLDGDRINEPLYHGDVVRLFVQHPRIHVRPYAIDKTHHNVLAIRRSLERIRRDMFWGEQIDAVLLPWESSTLMIAFGETLQLSQRDRYLAQIRAWGETEMVWRETFEIIVLLEDLVAYGARVYTISGNGGQRMVNTYSFAQGVVTVGAAEQELRHFVADNVFVNDHANASFEAVRVDGLSGVLGYDINADGCVDIGLDATIGRNMLLGELRHVERWPRTHWKRLVGSSFAAPTALKRALVGDEEMCALN